MNKRSDLDPKWRMFAQVSALHMTEIDKELVKHIKIAKL